jgi:cytochrome c oxidase cbb3-type subunit 3
MSAQDAESGEVAELPRRDEPVRDGIAEDDNAIPLWFNVGFYGLIGVGIAYILWYALLSGWSQRAQYAAEVAVADARRATTAAALPTSNPYHGNAGAVADGKQVFEQICMACHLVDGRGLVGPSLVDPYWKYGHSDTELYQTVSGGRPAGMPPWGAQLGSEKIWKVLAYVETLPKSEAPGVGAPDYAPPAPAAAPPGSGG